MEKYNTVIFDIDRTLLTTSNNYLKEELRKLYNVNGEDFEILCRQIDSYYYTLDNLPGIKISREVIAGVAGSTIGMLEELGRSAMDFIYDTEDIQYNSQTISGAEETLKYLRDKRYAIVALSNWFKDFQELRLIKADLLKYFDNDGIYGVNDTYMKPDITSIMRVFKRYNKDKCILIGDSLRSDIECANNAGIDSIWFNNDNKPSSPIIRPTYMVKALPEIKGIL